MKPHHNRLRNEINQGPWYWVFLYGKWFVHVANSEQPHDVFWSDSVVPWIIDSYKPTVKERDKAPLCAAYRGMPRGRAEVFPDDPPQTVRLFIGDIPATSVWENDERTLITELGIRRWNIIHCFDDSRYRVDEEHAQVLERILGITLPPMKCGPQVYITYDTSQSKWIVVTSV